MITFKQYITENEDKIYYVLVPKGDPKEPQIGHSLMPNDIGTIYKGQQYYLCSVFMHLLVKFKIKKHPKLKNISMQNYTKPHAENPRQYAPIKEYEIPYMQLFDIIDIDVEQFRGELSTPINGKKWHRNTKVDLPESEKEYIIGEALHQFTEELKERFKGLTNRTMPLEQPYREIYDHSHEFRSVVDCIIKYIQKYNLI
jgi:hypothetical protein